jgi:hypothetical protein
MYLLIAILVQLYPQTRMYACMYVIVQLKGLDEAFTVCISTRIQ